MVISEKAEVQGTSGYRLSDTESRTPNGQEEEKHSTLNASVDHVTTPRFV